MDLFYRPEPEQPEDLVAKLLRMADNGSTADYPEGWFEQEVEEWPDPPATTRFEPGDNVKFRDNGNGVTGGYIVGEPHAMEGTWWYTVYAFDEHGPVGQVQAPEEALLRPSRYDEPGESTMSDWLDIPPEAEEYYRTAMIKDIGQPESESYGEWFKPVEPYVMEQAKYFHLCPTCNGPLERRGDFYTCQRCPFEYPPGGEKTAGQIWDEMFSENPPEQTGALAFIYSPSEKWIRWTGPRGMHDEIENELLREGRTVPKGALYGRYFPGDRVDPVVIYGKEFSEQPWSYQRAVRSLVQLNAPTHP